MQLHIWKWHSLFVECTDDDATDKRCDLWRSVMVGEFHFHHGALCAKLNWNRKTKTWRSSEPSPEDAKYRGQRENSHLYGEVCRLSTFWRSQEPETLGFGSNNANRMQRRSHEREKVHFCQCTESCNTRAYEIYGNLIVINHTRQLPGALTYFKWQKEKGIPGIHILSTYKYDPTDWRCKTVFFQVGTR